MSPRRMDISSLLRDPSPQPDDPPRPRTIDALLHHPQQPDHPPASILSLLNAPRPSLPFPPRTDPPQHRPPFLGLDALVHVASEERRRITAVSASSVPDRVSQFPALVHDNDKPSRHYSYPLPSFHRHPDLPSFQDSSRPYKRPCPHSPPRSPSPRISFPQIPAQPTSPSIRPHPSASPSSNYPTLRHQPMEPFHDARTMAHPPSLSLQHTSPFLHSIHPSQLSAHSSPRNSSPHRHSPQLLRSQQHHSSPIHHSGSLMSAPAEFDMSPRYGHGPRMAGGIQVLSDDSSMRDPPRLDFSNYQSPGRDLSPERLFSDSHPEHARYEPSKLSPLFARTFSLDDERYQAKATSHKVEDQECVLPRERVRSRLAHAPLVDVTTDTARVMDKEIGLPPLPPPERHPIRVWEEQPTPREVSRRVSPVRKPDILPGFAQFLRPCFPLSRSRRHLVNQQWNP
ncbi:hypothetical protein EV363DRAFT_1393133 [Boletus edulis]|nr:hypothetical protein EV363DRAFT_1393133 [Boletus edulis]